MKKLLLVLAVVLTCSLNANAQRKVFSPAEQAEKMVSMLEQKSLLSDQKRNEVKEVFIEYFDDVKGNKKNRSKFAETRDSKIKEILGDEEYKSYLELLASKNEGKRNGRKGSGKNG